MTIKGKSFSPPAAPVSDPRMQSPATGQPAFMRTIHFLYAYRCNLHCEHCVHRCGPDKAETMGIRKGRTYIEQASRAGIRWIVFRGGEPFLHYPAIRNLLQYARELDIRPALFTNGSWASTRERTTRLLLELKQAGLQSLTLATSRYHLRHVSQDKLINLLAVAKKLGIRAGVKIARLSRDPISEGLYRSLQPLAGKILVQEVSPLGRASPLRSAVNLGTCRSLHRPGCLTPPLLLPGGRLLACCNLPAQDLEKNAYPFFLGNVEQRPLKDLLKKWFSDPLLNVLRVQGPARLFALLAETAFVRTSHMPSLYHDSCDLCFHLFRYPQQRSAIHTCLRKLHHGEAPPVIARIPLF